jgi:hypothetical protein
MRRFLMTMAALGAIAWSAPAWAAVDVDTIPQGNATAQETGGQTISAVITTKDGKKVEVRGRSSGGHVKYHISEDVAQNAQSVQLVQKNDKGVIIFQSDSMPFDQFKKTGVVPMFQVSLGTNSNSSMYSQSFYNTHVSIYGGAADMLNWSTRSASGFYTAGGTTNGAGSAGTAFGGAFAWDFGRAWGLIFSAVAVYDQFDTALTWTGKCAGVTCNGAGRVVDNNFIGEFKATLPLPGNNSINGYVGAGVTIKSPVGAPTGPGGPEIWGKDRVTAFRVGCEIDHQFDPSWSGGFKIGYQHTDSSSYATSLPGERFLMGPQNTWLAVAVVTFTPQISGPTLFGNVM